LSETLVEIFTAKVGLVQVEVTGRPIVLSVGKNVDPSIAIIDVDDGDGMRSGRVQSVCDRGGVAIRAREKVENFPALKLHAVEAAGRSDISNIEREFGGAEAEDGGEAIDEEFGRPECNTEDETDEFEGKFDERPKDTEVIEKQGQEEIGR